MTVHRVPDDAAGERFDVIAAALTGWSRARVAQAIDEGSVTLDGQLARRSMKVAAGQSVEVRAVEKAPAARPAPPAPDELYRDEHLLVVDKPVGLVVHPGVGHSDDTLVDALRAAGVPLASAGGAGREGIVHRLDRDTSGAMLVASSNEAHAALVAAIGERRVERRYLALVVGEPRDHRGRIEGPIGRHSVDRTRYAVRADGKPAVTRYCVIATASVDADGNDMPVSLLALQIETGRTHQIRVHMSAMGHPVVADPLYGDARSRSVGTRLQMPRCALHAWQLAFDHPIVGARISVTAPIPDDLGSSISRAGLELPATPAR